MSTCGSPRRADSALASDGAHGRHERLQSGLWILDLVGERDERVAGGGPEVIQRSTGGEGELGELGERLPGRLEVAGNVDERPHALEGLHAGEALDALGLTQEPPLELRAARLVGELGGTRALGNLGLDGAASSDRASDAEDACRDRANGR